MFIAAEVAAAAVAALAAAAAPIIAPAGPGTFGIAPGAVVPPSLAMRVARLVLSIFIPAPPSSWSSFQLALADSPSPAMGAATPPGVAVALVVFGSALQYDTCAVTFVPGN